MAIQTSSVSFPPLRGNGPRTAQATVVFPRAVLRAAAALTDFSAGFSGGDHHFGNLQIQLDPVVNGDAVVVEVTYGLRDWSGNWDDDYSGQIEFAVIADLISPTSVPPRTDINVTGIELSQGIQFFQSYKHLDSSTAMPDNSIRLVAGKNLGVRAYVDYDSIETTSPISTLTGELTVTTSSGATTAIAPLSTIAPRPEVAIDRGSVGHTLNFMVPGDWCGGELELMLQVFDAANPTPRSVPFIRTARFLDVTPLEVHAVAVHYTGQSLNLAAPTVADVVAAFDFTERTYPVGQVILGGYQALDYGEDLKPSDDGDDTPGFDGILDILEDLRGGGSELFVAFIPAGGIDTEIDSTGWSIGGIERSGVGVSFVSDQAAVAHEIGHAFGRDHVRCDDSARCDDPASPDDDYPQYAMLPRDLIGEFGFDPIANVVKDPSTTFDFMGYSSDKWVSPYTYTALMGALPPTGNGPQSGSISQQLRRFNGPSGGGGLGLMLRLTAQLTGDVMLEPSFIFDVPRVPLRRRRGEWRAEQLNEDGELLQSIALDVRQSCISHRVLRIRQLLSVSKGASLLVIRHHGKEVLKVPFGEPPKIEASLDRKRTSVSWKGDDGIWVMLQGLDYRGIWRGVVPRTQEHAIAVPAESLRKYRRLRLLGTRELATAIVDLPFDVEETVSGAEIVTRVVGQRVLKAWVCAPDGPEAAKVRWSDEAGREIGRGHTLDLRGKPRLNVVRVSAVGASRLVPDRVLTLEHRDGRLRIGSNRVSGEWRTNPIAAHAGKPDHEH